MTFIKYQHVQHFGADETEGLTDGVCYIFPKMDGSNMCAYTEDGEIRCMSRNCILDGDHPFTRYVKGHPETGRILKENPGIRLYGEWMTPHAVRSYTADTWEHWFVFEVCSENKHLEHMTQTGEILTCEGEYYIPYDIYSRLLDDYGVDYIPPLAVIDRPSGNDIQKMADEDNVWHITEGQGCGEGVVVKRYGYRNRYGETYWAKVINTQFRTMRLKQRHRRLSDGDTTLEEVIAENVVTLDLVNKEYAKIAETDGKVNQGKLLGIVWKCVIDEFIWDILKKYRNPVIDFGRLRDSCLDLVKEMRPELFGGVPLDGSE